MTGALAKVLTAIDSGQEASLARLFQLLRIPSISTDPVYADDCQRAAKWLVEELASLGFTASVRQTPGHPMVVAHGPRIAGTPHVLFYGHYDVQPVDPLELWRKPPFEPTRILGESGKAQIAARGASDDKGQVMTFIEACRAWNDVTGSLPISVSVFLEGEEESGSPSLKPFLLENREELSADIALICDTDMWDTRTPAVTVMLRGLVGEEIEVSCASRDLHSGLYGGAARNPIHLLSSILAGLHDDAGRVTLPGYYDGVEEVPEQVLAQWRRLSFDSQAFLGEIGLSLPAGEAGRDVLEKIWARPTAEVNGISGGYEGEGFKTVIPAKASAKISFRLVGKQDPDGIRAAFRAYVRKKIPKDCSVDFRPHGGSPAITLAMNGELLCRARQALAQEWGAEAALIGSGGSIPVVGDFKRILKLDSLMIGFAQADDRIHSPNEKYDLASFQGGIRSWARILAAFAK